VKPGAPNAGVVTFHPLNANETRIMLQMKYEPDGLVESAGDLVGVTSRRVEGTWSVSKNLSSREE
jgi:hypothetical protein